MMGFRTVVMLSNDRASEWENDPQLGKKIACSMNHAMVGGRYRGYLGYGSVVECVHADTQTLAVLDMYDGFKAISYAGWCRGQSAEDVSLKLLKDAVDKLGFRLVRKTFKEQ